MLLCYQQQSCHLHSTQFVCINAHGKSNVTRINLIPNYYKCRHKEAKHRGTIFNSVTVQLLILSFHFHSLDVKVNCFNLDILVGQSLIGANAYLQIFISCLRELTAEMRNTTASVAVLTVSSDSGPQRDVIKFALPTTSSCIS